MRSSVAAVSLAVLFSATALAQQPAPVVAPRIVTRQILFPACPIGFSAQANGLSRMARAADGSPAETRQAVSLEFRNSKDHTLTSATVVVHGANQTSLYLETGSRAEKPESRSFQLEPTGWQDGSAQDKVVVSGIAVLRSAEITEMRFADGTVWHPTAFSACHARLNGFRLVPAFPQ